MPAPARLSACLLALAVTAVLVSGCTATPDPAPTDLTGGGGAGGAETTEADVTPADTGDGATGLDAAEVDGMPQLDITPCERLDDYTYTPTAGNTQWYFHWTCATRDAYDATTAALVAQGYSASPTVISEGDYTSERTYLQADANGGSTEVQANLVGWTDELEFEIYVTLTLP